MICGLILAAGAGTRFGEASTGSKLLEPLEGRPLLEHAVRAQCAVRELELVAVVLGASADEIEERVDFMRATVIHFEGWQEGQAASLRCGVEYLFGGQGAERVIVTLGDEPLITPEVIARFVSEPPGTRAVYNGRPGHPVVLGREHYEAIAALAGDEGARSILRGSRRIECSHLCSGRDVDTPQDLEEIRHEARAVI